MISQEEFKALISYDPCTGVFTNIVPRGRNRGGSRAGTAHTTAGYRYITVAGEKHAEHQWAFLYMLGRLPAVEIDHANGVVDDNRWENLREADRFKNLANMRCRRRGLKGVIKTSKNRWGARVRYNGTRISLGCFATEAEAHAAYAKKAVELFGEFARVQ